MILELTPKFASDEAVKAARIALGEMPVQNLMLFWSKLARMSLKTGTFRKQKKAIDGASTLIEVDDKLINHPGLKVMLKTDMVRVSEKNEAKVPSTLTEDDFESWWAAYPPRMVKGKAVKIGKPTTKRYFFNQIRDRETFDNLMSATTNYSGLCNNLPKDPERFLKADFWKEYLSDAMENESSKAGILPLIDEETMNRMLGQ